jgi:hypothetical protein
VSGTDGSGGGFDVAAAPAGAVLLLDPVRPALLLAMVTAGIPSREY